MPTNQTIERVDLDPNTLLVDVNIRKKSKPDKDFVASIKELGVLVPLVAVRTASGEVRVRFGHRRTLAAIEAGLPTVPVEIIGNEATDDDGQIERLLGQYAENVHRSDLTAGEKIEVVAQLSAFGVKAGEITKKTRLPKKDVKAAIAVAGSELAKKASERYDFLTLDQAAAVAEFEDDSDAVKRLIVSAQEGGFDHIAQMLREDRQEKIEIAKAEAALVKQGVTVVERPDYNSPVKTLVQIRRTKRTLTDQAHASCPGHAAFVEAYFEYDNDDDLDAEPSDTGHWITEVTYVCTDPVAYGHLKAVGNAANANTPRDTTAQDAAEEAARNERRRVIANNKAWRAASEVRREFVKNLMGRTKAPKGAQAFIALWLADPVSPASNAINHRHSVACDLLGVEPSSYWSSPKADGTDLVGLVANASLDRAEVLILAMALGSHEAVMTEQVWRGASHHHGRYLRQLAEWGYGLSEIEQSVIDRLAQSDDEDEFDVPTCRTCGCTDEHACDGGCSWVEDPQGLGDLCSACADE
jgi:ParB family chromosome partitioning protein